MDTDTDRLDSMEELDLAELLAYRHADTPLWDELLNDYDADAIDAIASGWPSFIPTEADDVTADDDEEDEEVVG